VIKKNQGLIDWWHPKGVLHEKFGHRIVYDASSKVDANLSSVLRDKTWCWLPARLDDLVTIQSKFPIASIGEIDQPVWSISKRGLYTCAETWESIRYKLIGGI
jgi:hypothetical protein